MQVAKVQAVAAIIERGGRYLVGKRSPHKAAPGYWCAICGRIEAGESQEQAVVREAREESGLDVVVLERLGECETRDGGTTIHWWLARPAEPARDARLANDEHSELRWVTVEELRNLEPVFFEDIPFFEQARRRGFGSAP